MNTSKFTTIDRYELLREFNKGKFMSFLNNDYNGKILSLLDSEGLLILENSSQKEDIIRYILAYSSYADVLFENEEFMNIFLDSRLENYYAVLQNLNNKTYDMILEKCNSENISMLLTHFNLDYQINHIKNWKYGIKPIYEILLKSNEEEIIDYILNNFQIDLSNYSYAELNSLFNKVRSINYEQNNKDKKEYINFPSILVTEELAQKLCSESNIFQLRETINTLGEITNNEVVEKYMERLENTIINENLLNKLYETIIELKQIHLKWSDIKEKNDKYKRKEELSAYLDSLYKIFGNSFSFEIENIINSSNGEDLNSKIENIFKRHISNYIIDYHFKDNYHNVITDINELIDFERKGHVEIDKSHLVIYNRISNIDKLSYEEQKELHNTLKKIDINTMFYDDMRFARDIVNQAIKDYSISSESIKQYKDEELSKEYGVDVYKIEDNPFFALVKTGRKKENITAGHSFSLIGHNGVAVYNSSNRDTFLYDSSDLNPEQIVHVFPFDSFTLYRPTSGISRASISKNSLLMPEEIIGYTDGKSYNELLLLERGDNTPDEKRIPYLRKLALYCLDEIKEEDILKAKESGVGIFLIDSSKIVHDGKFAQDFDLSTLDIGYYTSVKEKDLEERRGL